MIDITALKAEIEADEGRVSKIYICPAGHPTFGVGHMVRRDDPEADLRIGAPVSEARVEAAFDKDVLDSLADCRALFDGFDKLPGEAQRILANMMFNLGRPRLSKFVRLHAAILDQDWAEAAEQMRDSKWHRQLPARSERLINRMTRLAVPV